MEPHGPGGLSLPTMHADDLAGRMRGPDTRRRWRAATMRIYMVLATNCDKRCSLDALLKYASRERFNVVLAWALDWLGRSLVDPLDTLNELETAGVVLVLHQQAINTITPAGRMFFQVTGAFAEFERGMLRGRVMAGLERARLPVPRGGFGLRTSSAAALDRSSRLKRRVTGARDIRVSIQKLDGYRYRMGVATHGGNRH
jgi:DNA invertase Pin-like site-specific DNA recombinase